MNLQQALRELKQTAKSLLPLKRVNFCIGNEACDLDSMVCAIAYAVFCNATKDREFDVALPIMNIPRVDFPLRTEAVYLFKKMNLSEHDLIFLDDIDLGRGKNNQKISFTLLDHNKISTVYDAAFVSEIIDHHEDEGRHKNARKTIEMVGSCATLVSEIILNKKESFLVDYKEVTQLLLETILLDTINLDYERGRGTKKDESIIESLEKIVNAKESLTEEEVLRDRKNLFSLLNSAKFKLDELSIDELLRKDYKEIQSHQLGISSVGCSLLSVIERGDFSNSIAKFIKQKKLNCLIVMTSFFEKESEESGQSNQFKRQLLIASFNDKYFNVIINGLENKSSNNLNLTPLTLSLGNEDEVAYNIKGYTQMNIKASRKVVMPFMTALLKDF